MDIQDMKVKSDKGDRYLLVVVDKAPKFMSTSPLPTKEALGVSRKLLELLLIWGARTLPKSCNTCFVG